MRIGPRLQPDLGVTILSPCDETGTDGLTQKGRGEYFTPEAVVSTLLRWAIRAPTDRLLDPSCGDGRFIAQHGNSVGVERNPMSARSAEQRAPQAIVYQAEFFAWAASTQDKFECSAGNPPFVRYQTFDGRVRERALSYCRALGAQFSGLTSSWAPFLVATASLLKRGGRMAFVVPAEIGHAPYAAPLLEYLVSHFDTVQLVAVRRKLFPELSEDCWLLYADGFGGSTTEIRLTAVEAFVPGGWMSPPPTEVAVAVSEWRSAWGRRLRPYLLPAGVRQLYRQVSDAPGARRLGEVARIGIGYVSGDNDFFHLRPSEADLWGVPSSLLQPTVRNGRLLPSRELTPSNVDCWRKDDQPIMLLRLQPSTVIPQNVRKYLDSSLGLRARNAFKCRNRDPWYVVPDVRIPDYFLAYMCGHSANLVRNSAAATSTNSVHGLEIRDREGMRCAVRLWESDFVALSRELEGHPLGGGMLKLEVREAGRVLIPPEAIHSLWSSEAVSEALRTMRHWRHHA